MSKVSCMTPCGSVSMRKEEDLHVRRRKEGGGGKGKEYYLGWLAIFARDRYLGYLTLESRYVPQGRGKDWE